MLLSTCILAVILTCPPCRGDFNADGQTDVYDFIEFNTCWRAGDMRADFTRDGKVTEADAIRFIAAWFECIE